MQLFDISSVRNSLVYSVERRSRFLLLLSSSRIEASTREAKNFCFSRSRRRRCHFSPVGLARSRTPSSIQTFVLARRMVPSTTQHSLRHQNWRWSCRTRFSSFHSLTPTSVADLARRMEFDIL